MNLELNDNEAGALLQLIDLAVKAGGLSVAMAAVMLAEKIKAAAKGQEAKIGEGKNENRE